MNPKLSILIPTVAGREDMLARLCGCLKWQLDAAGPANVECIILPDPPDADPKALPPIGDKRNQLVNRAAGRFVVFIDDDDLVSPHYVRKLLAAIDADPHCQAIGFLMDRFVDGNYDGQSRNAHDSQRAVNLPRSPDGTRRYLRFITHTQPVLTDIARAVRFPEISYGEDTDYAGRLHKAIRRASFIDEVLYYYLYRSQPARAGERVHIGAHA